jgi:hypothetical protein
MCIYTSYKAMSQSPMRVSFFFLLENQTGMTQVSARAPPDEEGERAFLALTILEAGRK